MQLHLSRDAKGEKKKKGFCKSIKKTMEKTGLLLNGQDDKGWRKKATVVSENSMKRAAKSCIWGQKSNQPTNQKKPATTTCWGLTEKQLCKEGPCDSSVYQNVHELTTCPHSKNKQTSYFFPVTRCLSVHDLFYFLLSYACYSHSVYIDQ